MKEITSILHISDLHRSREDKITNSALLSSLVTDNDKYTGSEFRIIKSPDLIIVSGDIIRGSIKETGSGKEIEEQYKEAEEFLDALCKQFLNGDRSRMVIIPGNHDIDWKYSKASMQKMEISKVFDNGNIVKAQILKGAINNQSNIRFSWKELSYYEIIDQGQYNRRIEAFANFYNSFYKGEKLFSLNPSEQYQIYDFMTYNITIIGFNSCYCNDHLRLVGDIHPDCIGKATMDLREYKNKGRLILGTWHHNTKGLPYDMNFMDSSRLKNFIDAGISLGFHGHQHKTEVIHDYNDVIEQKKITVFSSGTLCGGGMELPVGTNRQYNLIEILSNESDKIDVTLHVREKTETSSFQNPIWMPGRIDSHLVSFHTFKVDKPKPPRLTMVLAEIEILIKTNYYEEAKRRLLALPLTEMFVRKYLLDAITETDDFDLAFTVFIPPQTEAECTAILGYAILSGNRVKMRDCLDAVSHHHRDDPSVKHLIRKLEALIK